MRLYRAQQRLQSNGYSRPSNVPISNDSIVPLRGSIRNETNTERNDERKTTRDRGYRASDSVYCCVRYGLGGVTIVWMRRAICHSGTFRSGAVVSAGGIFLRLYRIMWVGKLGYSF